MSQQNSINQLIFCQRFVFFALEWFNIKPKRYQKKTNGFLDFYFPIYLYIVKFSHLLYRQQVRYISKYSTWTNMLQIIWFLLEIAWTGKATTNWCLLNRYLRRILIVTALARRLAEIYGIVISSIILLWGNLFPNKLPMALFCMQIF